MITTNSDITLPDDPAMLLSVVNTMLRDRYPAGLDALCDDLGIECSELEDKLRNAGFEYTPQANKFW